MLETFRRFGGSPVDPTPSTAEALPKGKIHPFSKIPFTLEPVVQFGCPSRFRISKKYNIVNFFTESNILNYEVMAALFCCKIWLYLDFALFGVILMAFTFTSKRGTNLINHIIVASIDVHTGCEIHFTLFCCKFTFVAI